MVCLGVSLPDCYRMTIKRVSEEFPRDHLDLSCDACPVMKTRIGCIAVLKSDGIAFREFSRLFYHLLAKTLETFPK